MDTRTVARSIAPQAWMRFLGSQRWFSGKGRSISSVQVTSTCVVDSALVVAVLKVIYEVGEDEDYLLPLLLCQDCPGEAIGQIEGRPVVDALSIEEGWRRLLEAFGRSHHPGDLELKIHLESNFSFRKGEFTMGSTDQTNSWAIVGGMFVKVYRRLQHGENLDVEVCRFLTQAEFPLTPVLRGVINACGSFGEATLLSVQDMVPNQGTGWDLARRQVDAVVRGHEVDYGPWGCLGVSLARLHRVLAAGETPGTQPLSTPDLKALAQLALALARNVLAELEGAKLDPAASGLAQLLRFRTSNLLRRIKAPQIPSGLCHRQRIHGDIHLGQVLWNGERFFIIDFEGEPARPVEERRRKTSVAKDVAGVLRSFDYAARAGLPEGAGAKGEAIANQWRNLARQAFRTAYEGEIGGEPFLPADAALSDQLISLFELEKAFYELRYELSHRPDWVGIPMAGLLDLTNAKKPV
ncbi:MAG TPA: phosphotransferase [Fibrobacteria bacterium]|nr:phosphotransferase [Fibrobacteria bacterium]